MTLRMEITAALLASIMLVSAAHAACAHLEVCHA